MNEDALRAMIREVIRSAGGGQPPFAAGSRPETAIPLHPSHYRYALPESDGPCLIEPAVPCTHCGYCQSHGH